MWRHLSRPREDWLDKVVSQGLIYPQTPKGDGTTVDYWNESAWYEFEMAEVEKIESATEELWGMCLEAVAKMARDLDDKRLGLPAGTLEFARESARRGDPSVYGRFDLRFDGGTPKMLELNGDTPTGLIESAVAQWNWLEDVMPDMDQFNSLHERLVARWEGLRAQPLFPQSVHFLWDDNDKSGEEEMTVHYMRDVATQAGFTTYGQPINHVSWDYGQKVFVDAIGNVIESAYKLYPWELMLQDDFGKVLLQKEERKAVRWVEPAWKVLLSTKALLPVLWEMYPGHENLLPAYFDEPRDLLEWAAKPLHGREGDNIKVSTLGPDGEFDTSDGGYGAEGYVYQEWCPLPSFDGNRAVIGSWVVDGQAAGMIVRESDGPVTDYYSRVCPHAITDTVAPDEETRRQWLAERTGPSHVPSLG
jgi:glutathionylspermidine synthase